MSKDTERLYFLIVLKEMKRKALSIIVKELMAIMMTLMMLRNLLTLSGQEKNKFQFI